MKKTRMIFVIAALAVGTYAQSRPYQPFVEKVFTPLRSRQLKVALNSELWIMYDMPTAELYMAWAGGSKGGTLKLPDFGWFNQNAHFPLWYIAEGTKYFETQVGELFSHWAKPSDIDLHYTKWAKQPRDFKNWSVTSGGADVFVHVRNLGYFVQGTTFKLHNALKLKDGGEIDVMEVPEGEGKKLTRKITFTGVPAGAVIKLKLPSGPNWAVSGKGRLEGGSLVHEGDGESIITVTF